MFRPKVDRISYGGAIIDHREKDAINRVIDSQGGSRWTVGEESVAFEKELAEKTGVRRAVVVNSGSSALLVALTALKLPKGSKVIIPAVNFPTAFNAIIQCGLVPYVVDVDLKTLNMDLEEVENAVTSYENISAVIAVNIASNPVDLGQLDIHSSVADTI
jgi:CDP-4-dehydro-6-deoxyglucose reductase, E1